MVVLVKNRNPHDETSVSTIFPPSAICLFFQYFQDNLSLLRRSIFVRISLVQFFLKGPFPVFFLAFSFFNSNST